MSNYTSSLQLAPPTIYRIHTPFARPGYFLAVGFQLL